MQKNRIDIITLGCSKNLVDSEKLIKQFKEIGYDVYHDSDNVKGEVVIINTCGFIGDAKEESINMILNFCQAKKARKIKRLYVMGCLSQRYAPELIEEIPEVDGFFGKFDWENIVKEAIIIIAKYSPIIVWEISSIFAFCSARNALTFAMIPFLSFPVTVTTALINIFLLCGFSKVPCIGFDTSPTFLTVSNSLLQKYSIQYIQLM